MKKPFIIALIGLSLAACNSDEFPPIADNDVEAMSTEDLRTEAEAMEIATNALNEFYPVKSRTARDLSQMNVVMLHDPISRSSATSNPLYVVNFGNESGYAIVSANKDAEPLLAVTESGSITSLDKIDNPGLRLFVDGAMKLKVDSTFIVPKPGDGGEHKVSIYWNDTIFHAQSKVEPRIMVNWGQSYPEGDLCPNKLSGCTPTAGAQALSYFEYPENLTLTFPERKSDQILLEWDKIKRIKRANMPWLSIKEDNLLLSSLCREIGHKIHADYSDPDITLASLYRLREFLRITLPTNKFSFSNWIETVPETNKVLGNGILLMQGFRLEPKDDKNQNAGYKTIGHAWVIDGYNYKNYTVYVYCQELDTPYVTLERQFEKTELYSHVNWGWNGFDNGYFRNDGFKTSNGQYDRDFAYFVLKTK